MKRLKTILLTGSLAIVALPACAGNRHHGYEYARVVRATPVYQTVRYPVDEQVCWEETTWQGRRSSAAPVVIGAVVGGVVGNQIGHGSGRAVATVAGAAVGGAIGAEVARHDNRGRAYPLVTTRCEVQRNWRSEARIVAWDVAYKHHGRVYQTRTYDPPGKRIRVYADARPTPYYNGYR